MTFPYYFEIFGFKLHPHPVMETIAYFAGFQVYLLNRRRERGNVVGVEHSLWIIVGAVFGALFGSKLLAWVESPQEFWAMRHDLRLVLGGKTIVGGLLGGWVGVEIAKKIMRITTRTGDACVLPLMVGIAIGRVGCFLTGLDDHTYGVASSLPWAVDFGDYIRRHPTQLYESVYVLVLGAGVLMLCGGAREGSRFRIFFAGYFLFRFGFEFIKPTYRPYFGMSAIQLASLAGMIVAGWHVIDIQSLGVRQSTKKSQ